MISDGTERQLCSYLRTPQPGTYGGYYSHNNAFRRRSLAIGTWDGLEPDGGPLAEDLRRKLSHSVVKEGYFQVLAASGMDMVVRSRQTGPTVRRRTAPRMSTVAGSPITSWKDAEQEGDDTQLFLELLSIADNAYVWSDSGERADLDSLPVANRAVITWKSREWAR